MFTGIVEEIGQIQEISSNKLSIKCVKILDDVSLGDSIAVNGVCLTVKELLLNSFVADISPETMSVTALKYLKVGNFVNLERALKADGRFGGHIVSGHIDGLGKLLETKKNGSFYDIKFELDQNQEKYAVKKGSITINGISLTIADIQKNIIKLAIIPHTFDNTVLKYLKIGDYVNIEVDILAKYIEKFLSTSDNKTEISLEFLQEHGF